MKLNMQPTPWPEGIKSIPQRKTLLTDQNMKLGTKLARKVSLAVLMSLMNRDGQKRNDPLTSHYRRSAETQSIKPPEGE